MDSKWVKRFIMLAEHVRHYSKDPSTKGGAVVVAVGRRDLLALGYNGFPRGVDDNPERYADREVKYRYVVHAERNAIYNAKFDTMGGALFSFPFVPCEDCALTIIQHGIANVYCPHDKLLEEYDIHVSSKYRHITHVTRTMFQEAGVMVNYVW